MKKRTTEIEIDEESIIDSFVESGRKEKMVESPAAEDSKGNSRKKKVGDKYVDTFLRKTLLQDRQSVYVSKKMHKAITRVLDAHGDKGITVSRYINNVLEVHFEMNMDEMKNLIKNKREEDYELF